MNVKDKEMIIGDWLKHTYAAEGVIQDVVSRAQDYAYQLGLERGKQNIARTVEVIEQTIKALDDQIAGNGTRKEQVEGVDAAYEALEKLLGELSC